MPPPKFTIHDVRYASYPEMVARAEALWKSGKVKNVRFVGDGYHALVQGTKPYEVSISQKSVDQGYCNCYMGAQDEMCKHLLAVAFAVLDATGGLVQSPPPATLEEAKREVAAGMRKIVGYSGSSRVWFSYQRKLATGAGMIVDGVAGLPATQKNAAYIWSLVMKLSNKLARSGVDDSDGVVGDAIYQLIQQLIRYAHEDPRLKEQLLKYAEDDTGFGFEEDLRKGVEGVV